MTEWSLFALAMAAFLSSHIIPRFWGLREKLIMRFGRRQYFVCYGIVSIVLLIWVITAAGRAPLVELWPQQAWMRWIPNLAMPVASVLVACGIGIKNANTLGGARNAVFEAENPGFAAISRHPLLLSLAFWATAHLLANGDLAHVILFGSFASFPVVAMWAFDKKTQRLMGASSIAFFAQTSRLSLVPLLQPDWLRKNMKLLAPRALLGLLGWAGLLHLHDAVIGAWPFP